MSGISEKVAYVDIVFDGPPSYQSGRFVEVEDASGKSINFGEWVQRPDGYWALRIAQPSYAWDEGMSPADARTALENIHEALTRCDRCDNSIEQAWDYCAWCGHQLVEPSPPGESGQP